MDFSTSVAYNYNEITKEYTKCYPQTHMNAVYTKDDETETLGNKLSDIDDKIEGTTRVFSSDTKPIKDGIWFDSSDTQSNVQQNSVAKEIINYIDTNIKNNVDNNTQNIESITTQLSENTQQLGFVEQLKLRFAYGIVGDGTDESSKLQQAISDAVEGSTIFFPSGIYNFKDVIINKSLYFVGQTGVAIDAIGTTLKLVAGGNYIFKYQGVSGSILSGGGVKGIKFDGDGQAALYLIRAEFISHLFVEKCAFNNVNGRAISLQRVQESGIFKSYFRKCGNDTSDVIYLDSVVSGNLTENINNLHIENNTFGGNSGNWIRSALDSNLDAVWIDKNKFEWDLTPTYSNSIAKAVISLGQISRGSVSNNIFTNFSDTNNHYNKLLEFINNNGTVTVRDNKFSVCNGIWITTARPRIVAKNNEAINTTLTINCTSAIAQDIDELIPISSNGMIGILSSIKSINFVSSHYVGGVQSRTFIYDVNSLAYCKTVKSSSTQYDEFGRIFLGNYAGF
jgi:hypothetical protein